MLKKLSLMTLAAAGLTWSAAAQHGHLNAGALGQNQGDKLYFANGSIFAADSGFAKELAPQSSGNYAGFYQGAITLTALATTVANGGPAVGAAAPGSLIMARVTSVQGPDGGYFSFWDHEATVPSFSYASGTTGANGVFALSDSSIGAGTAGGDPFGHIHGRAFTVSAPGEYTVGFSLFDASNNGLNGGPIHADSDTLFIKFQTIPEPGTLALLGVGAAALVIGLRRRAG